MKEKVTRRSLIAGGSAMIIAPSFIGVTSGATDSGNVEIETTATIPTDTNINIRVYEDTNGDGSVDNQQAKDIPDGSGQITEYSGLDGIEASGVVYYLEITLTTNDDTITPELDSATITVPEETQTPDEPTQTETEPQGLDGIIDNYLFFVAGITGVIAGIGLTSKSLAIGAIAAYSTFALIALETGTQLLENILIVTLVLVFIGFSFKFWRLEGMGS